LIAADKEISVYMNFGYINLAAFDYLFCDAVVAVDDFDITVAEIGIVAVNKAVVAVLDCIVFDAVAGENVYLHAVICHKKVVAAFHDFMVGVIKQVVDIKLKTADLAVVIGESTVLQIDRCFDVDAVIPVVEENNPLFIRKYLMFLSEMVQ